MLWHRFYRVVYHLVNNALGTGFPNPILATHTAIRIETTTDFIVSHSVIFTLVFLWERTAGGTATGPGDGGGGDRGPRGRGLQMDGSATQGTSTSQRLVGQRCQSGITTPIGDDEISNFL